MDGTDRLVNWLFDVTNKINVHFLSKLYLSLDAQPEIQNIGHNLSYCAIVEYVSL